MDVRSLTRHAPRSTEWILACEHVCDQVPLLLEIEESTARRVFLGEPVQVVLAMAQWVLSHEADAGFDAAQVLVVWTKRRGRGAWREPDGAEHGGETDSSIKRVPHEANGGYEGLSGEERRLARSIAEHWRRHPEELWDALQRMEHGANGGST